ncbi:MAG: hypothetical protein RLZZ618_962 [Pseudomonadota bacterium]
MLIQVPVLGLGFLQAAQQLPVFNAQQKATSVRSACRGFKLEPLFEVLKSPSRTL